MSAFRCPVEGCADGVRHEHRQARFDINTGMLWVESYQHDQQMTNEARAVHDLPKLVYSEPGGEKPTHQLTWSPEAGIQPAGAEVQHLYQQSGEPDESTARD